MGRPPAHEASTEFSDLTVVTSAPQCTKAAAEIASANQVTLVASDELEALLQKHSVTIKDVRQQE